MFKTRISLLLTLALVIAAAISVGAQTSSPPTDRSSLAPLVRPTPPAATPAQLLDPQLQAQILAKLSSETARANAAEKLADEQKAQLAEEKAIATKERERAETLAKANADRREEAAGLRLSVGYLTTSVTEYKAEVLDQRKEIEKLRSSRKWYGLGGALGGAAFGIAACRAVNP